MLKVLIIRPLSKSYCIGKFLRRFGARILMYLRVHSGSVLRVYSQFILCSWFGKRFIVLISCFLFVSSLYASTIYGIEAVGGLNGKQHFPVYVQMGSFKILKHAQDYREALRKKYNCKVIMYSKNDQYKVTLGPFTSYQGLSALSKAKKVHDFRLPVAKDITYNRSKFLESSKNGSWFISGLIGGQQFGLGSSTSVNNGSGLAAPYDQDIYRGYSSADMSTLLGFYTGYRWNLFYGLIENLSLGLQYQHFFLAKSAGQVREFSLPEYFTNYSYAWHNSTDLLLANAKINFANWQSLSPYVNFGIGMAFNHNQGYSENAYANITPRISPAFQSNDQNNLAYIIGAGLDYKLAINLLVSIGYQYSYLGNTSSGYGLGSWSAEKLDFGNAKSNAFVFGLTYIFPENLKTDV